MWPLTSFLPAERQQPIRWRWARQDHGAPLQEEPVQVFAAVGGASAQTSSSCSRSWGTTCGQFRSLLWLLLLFFFFFCFLVVCCQHSSWRLSQRSISVFVAARTRRRRWWWWRWRTRPMTVCTKVGGAVAPPSPLILRVEDEAFKNQTCSRLLQRLQSDSYSNWPITDQRPGLRSR